MTNSRRRTIGVILVALMLVVVPASAAATPTSTHSNGAGDGPTLNFNQAAVNNSTDVDPADTVYVTAAGDAVLVYSEEMNESTRMELGMNMSEGLMHMLVTDELESEVTGTASAALGTEALVTNGSMTAPKPDELRSLDATADVTRTSSEASSSMTLDAVVAGEDSTMQAGTFSTQGELQSTASSFDFSGNATVSGMPSVAAMGPMEHDVVISETNTGYTVEVSQDYQVSYYARQQWNTEANATQTLRNQYGLLAAQLGGTSDVTIDSHEFTETGENTYQLALDYSVEYRDVHEGVTQLLAERLAEAENFSLTEAEAREISERLQELEFERVSGAVSIDDESMNADWDVQLENFDTLALALLDLAESSKEMPESTQEQLDQTRNQLEASKEANVVQTASWQGEFATQEDGSASVSFQSESEVENWADYVSALEDRGIDTTTYELQMSASTTDGEVTAELNMTMSDEDLIAQMFAPGATDSEAPEELTDAVQTFRQADFEQAKMDVSAQEGEVRVEAGAKFANASAFADVMTETYDYSVRSVVSQPEDGSQVTYVRVDGLVGENPTESEVRSLEIADEDTEIKLPGEWDREFPSMDVSSANEFLGAPPDQKDESSTNSNSNENATTTDDTDGSGGSFGMPGFGLGIGLVALLASLVLFSRRRSE